ENRSTSVRSSSSRISSSATRRDAPSGGPLVRGRPAHQARWCSPGSIRGPYVDRPSRLGASTNGPQGSTRGRCAGGGAGGGGILARLSRAHPRRERDPWVHAGVELVGGSQAATFPGHVEGRPQPPALLDEPALLC